MIPDEELSLLLALEQQVRALISRPTPDLRLRSVSEITLAALDDLRRPASLPPLPRAGRR
jgi:hypothetical protein